MTTTTTRPARRYQHPRTGTWYVFPKDAKRYAALVGRLEVSEHACEHGHFGCAAWDGGPCLNEALSWTTR